MPDKKQKVIESCESTMHCKSTASLTEEIEEDLLKIDGSLKELIQNDEDKKQEVEDN
jgi:hypothetical protein|tara:strand:+ start:304 stop:474 length:171 start_codon:yes stop_codon:yes gene_type:complete